MKPLQPTSTPTLAFRALFSALACWLGLCASSGAQAQVLRCVDAQSGTVTYTNSPCADGQKSTQIQAAQSPEEIAQERAQAAQARERLQEQLTREQQERQQREAAERQARLAADQAQARASAHPENSAACQQARQRYNAILSESSTDSLSWSERSQAAQAQMEMSCLGAAAYQQLQQSRALQPNAINRPQWGYGPGYGHGNGRPPQGRPLPPKLPPPRITQCNVFRCYDSRGGVHPIP